MSKLNKGLDVLYTKDPVRAIKIIHYFRKTREILGEDAHILLELSKEE